MAENCLKEAQMCRSFKTF